MTHTANADMASSLEALDPGNEYLLAPDYSAASRFLGLLDPAGKFTFQTFNDSHKKRTNLVRVLHGTLEQHWEALTSLNRQGAGVFVTVNETDLTGRKAKNIKRVRAVYVDLDDAPLHPVEALHKSVQPSIIVESSPQRYHAYWLTNDIALDEFTSIQKALARRFQGDSNVTDLPRVMRIPGFLHQKGTPFLTRIKQADGKRFNKQSIQIITSTSSVQFDIRKQVERGVQTTGRTATVALKIEQGKRNEACTQRAAILRNRGLSGEALHDALAGFNVRRCTPPLPEEEIYQIYKWAEGKEGKDNTTSAVLATITDEEVAALDVRPLEWMVPGILSRGLYMLAGRQKSGKSWLALNLATAITSGEDFLGEFEVNQSGVLYISYEDDKETIRERRDMVMRCKTLRCLHYATQSAKMTDTPDGGPGVLSLRNFLAEHPDVKVVILDPLIHFIAPMKGRESEYEFKYRMLGILKKLADELGIAIIVCHHISKPKGGKEEDIFDRVLGSTALGAGVDGTWILERPSDRTNPERTLRFELRRAKEPESLSLQFIEETGRFVCLGRAGGGNYSRERTDLLAALVDLGGEGSLGEIMEKTGKKKSAAINALSRLIQRGQVKKTRHGRYALTHPPSGCNRAEVWEPPTRPMNQNRFPEDDDEVDI